ncbi:hypothetical protein EI94DRAFT_462350 [Lactarius quietus]|nr:hypothetical protein EI94DRAFT_462350 [Lactarius quietus]
MIQMNHQPGLCSEFLNEPCAQSPCRQRRSRCIDPQLDSDTKIPIPAFDRLLTCSFREIPCNHQLYRNGTPRVCFPTSRSLFDSRGEGRPGTGRQIRSPYVYVLDILSWIDEFTACQWRYSESTVSLGSYRCMSLTQ